MKINNLDMIEEITRLDGSTYFELGSILHNNRAELAAERKLIQQVRIIKINIPRSSSVEKLENYLSDNFQIPEVDFDEWVEWKKDDEAAQWLNQILLENRIA